MSQYYSIKDLEALCGIKAHTIRIWEKRYELLSPERTDTNIRRYNTDQLRKVLNVSLLLNNGHKISKIAQMTDVDLGKTINKVSTQNENSDQLIDNQINQLTTAMVSFNERLFEKLFSTIILRFGLQDAFTKILYPFLEKVGLMWCVGEVNPAMEHFITNLVRQKLFCAIDGLITDDNTEGSWLLFLPDNEYHEIGLLMSYFIVRSSGRRAIYLGQDVPFENLKATVDQTGVENLLTFFVRYGSEQEQVDYMGRLTDSFPDKRIFLAADPQRFQFTNQKGFSYLSSVDHLVQELRD
mgnify:CR=1 FL=1